MHKIELLAPAGDIEIAKAAFGAGADACYIGSQYSARAYAKNFGEAELQEVINYAHLRGKKIYIAINTMLFESEMASALAHVKTLYDMGADALIMADLGLMKEVRALLPNLAIHASTQAAVQNKEGAALLGQLGVQRVIAAREMSITELSHMAAAGMAVEAFCHGALCSGVSGMCLYSSAIGPRSGNRGRCAQPCRMAYTLMGQAGHHLSTKDLCTLPLVPQLIEAGLCSLKIEGRMKQAPYVASAVAAYRAAIDAYYEKTQFAAEPWVDLLARIYNRGGFTAGFIGEETDITYTARPDHVGVYVGKLQTVQKGMAQVQTKRTLAAGDGVEAAGIGYALTKAEKNADGYMLNVPVGAKVGDEVYLRVDMAAQTQAMALGEDKFVMPVDFVFAAAEHGAARLQAHANGFFAQVEQDGPLETAHKPVDVPYIKNQLGKTGQTVFAIQKCDVQITGIPFLPSALLNRLRREVLEKLEKQIMEAKREALHAAPAICIGGKWQNPAAKPAAETPYVAVWASKAWQASVALLNGADRVYFAPESVEQLGLLNDDDQRKIYLVLPPFLAEAEGLAYEGFYKNGEFAGLVAPNISGVALAQKLGAPFVADYFCNVANTAAYEAMISLGAKNVAVSTEIDTRQIGAIAGAQKEVLVYGKHAVMALRHCPSKKVQGCANCADAALVDKLGYQFPLKKSGIDKDGYCPLRQVHQSVPLFIEELAALRHAGVAGVRLTLLDESEALAAKIVRGFADAWKQDEPLYALHQAVKENYGQTTRGHSVRGVE